MKARCARVAIRASVALLLFLSAAGLIPQAASAHWADQAVAEIVLDAAEVRVVLTFPTGLAAFADDDRNGRISSRELQVHRPELERFFRDRISLRAPGTGSGGEGTPGAMQIAEVGTGEPRPPAGSSSSTHTAVTLIYSWPQPVTTLMVRYDLFLPGVPTASCLATVVQGAQVRSIVFTPERRETVFHLVAPISRTSQAASFVALGVRHILTGYDHLLFLLSLLIVGGAVAPLLKVVTAFTAAHSITLSVAALGLVAMPARWVESAIALSIAYVAAENLWRRTIRTRQRWLLTFGFGLVHGLGFASALRELAMPRASLVTSLIGFNVGVELGQLAVVAAAVVGLRLLQSWPRGPALRRWVSAGTVVAGLVWFVQRALLSG